MDLCRDYLIHDFTYEPKLFCLVLWKARRTMERFERVVPSSRPRRKPEEERSDKIIIEGVAAEFIVGTKAEDGTNHIVVRSFLS